MFKNELFSYGKLANESLKDEFRGIKNSTNFAQGTNDRQNLMKFAEEKVRGVD